MKKVLACFAAILCISFVVVSFCSCGKEVTIDNSETQESETVSVSTEVLTETLESTEPEIIAGGWSDDISTEYVLDETVKAVFEKATSGTEYEGNTPVAYLGSQVVAGLNHAVLVKNSDGMKVMIIYEALDDTCTVTSTADFNLAEYNNGNIDMSVETQNLLGGWACPTDVFVIENDEKINNAKVKYEDVKIEPMAVIGTQVVAGQNTSYICKASKNDVSVLKVITVYTDLQGTSEITSATNISAANF